MRTRPTAWWLAQLRKRRLRMAGETLDLSAPFVCESSEEKAAAIAFFNAALRAEQAGLLQAHKLALQMESRDPELAECLRLYGDEEGWHKRLLTDFITWLGGSVRPMGLTTRSFYGLYARARRMESVVLVNLMFETIGSTTYRLALRRATHPTVRQMLTILTRDESFHVPLNVHFLRSALAQCGGGGRRLRGIHAATFVALLWSTAPSRRRAERFDRIPRRVLADAYAFELARLFIEEDDLGLAPSARFLRFFGLDRAELLRHASPVSLEAAERAADRHDVVVESYR